MDAPHKIKVAVGAILAFGLVNLLFGILSSIFYSFDVAVPGGESVSYGHDFTALWVSLPYVLIPLVLVFVLVKRNMWGYWFTMVASGVMTLLGALGLVSFYQSYTTLSMMYGGAAPFFLFLGVMVPLTALMGFVCLQGQDVRDAFKTHLSARGVLLGVILFAAVAAGLYLFHQKQYVYIEDGSINSSNQQQTMSLLSRPEIEILWNDLIGSQDAVAERESVVAFQQYTQQHGIRYSVRLIDADTNEQIDLSDTATQMDKKWTAIVAWDPDNVEMMWTPVSNENFYILLRE